MLTHERQHRIGKGFDLLTPIYDFCQQLFFGNEIHTFQSHALSLAKPAQRACIIGGGSGLILKQCFEQEVATEYIYVELSKKMIDRSKQRLTPSEKARTVFHLGELDQDDERKIDLIIFPFVLDCYTEAGIEDFIHSLEPLLTEEAQLLHIDFNQDTSRGARIHFLQRGFIRLLYLFFRLTTNIPAQSLPNIHETLRRSGWKAENTLGIRQGWIGASIWAKSPKRYVRA